MHNAFFLRASEDGKGDLLRFSRSDCCPTRQGERTRSGGPAGARRKAQLGHPVHLAGCGEARGVARIARDLGIQVSSCLHILRELVVRGVVGFDPRTKTYTLGFGLLALARGVTVNGALVEIVQVHIDRIARQFGARPSLNVFDGTDNIVVFATARDGS